MVANGPALTPALETSPMGRTAGRIVGDGEMAERVRKFDWGTTPLGPIETWPQELVSAVNLTLSAPVPARTLWGRDLILIYNDSYRRFPGKRHPDALGKPARDVYHESWDVVGPILEDAFATGRSSNHEKLCVPIETDEGLRNFYLDYAYGPVFRNGQVAGLYGTLHDVTSEVNALRTLRQREAELKAIYSSSLEYIGLLTADGIVVDSNRASLEFAGNTHQDVMGKPYAETAWFAGTPGAPEAVRRGIAAAAQGATFRSEMALVRPNGEKVFFHFSLTPVRDDAGKVVYLVPEARDITEVKRAEAALLQSEKLAAVGRLASSIAHEINNPLESVMNLIYLARRSDPEDARKYLDLADQEIRRVSIIANQTLRFHKQASNPQAVTAADLFATVMSIYEGRLRNAHVNVEKKFRTSDPVVCFQGDVRQVLNNLVSNALEAMPFGGRLLIRSRTGRNWKTGQRGLILTIADNGGGIPPGAREHIFDAFFTTKGTAGNGLGLWVCQEIVQRHHGALKVRSTQRAGRSGTAFTLFLPFDPPVAAEGQG